MAADAAQAQLNKLEFKQALETLSQAISKGEADSIRPFVDTSYASSKGAKGRMVETVMLIAKAQMALAVNDPDVALKNAKEATNVIEVALDTRALIGEAMKALCAAQLIGENANYAKKTASDMLARGQSYGHKDTIAHARVMLAKSYLAMGQDFVVDASEFGEKALAYFRAEGPTSKGMATALATMAEVNYVKEQVQAGLTLAEEAVNIFRDLGYAKDLAGALQVLIQGYALSSDPMAGLRAANSELSSLRRAGNTRGQADVMLTIAETHATLGEPLGALKNAKAALALYQGLGDKFSEALTLVTVAEMQRAQGLKEEATVTVETALKLFKDLGSNWGQEQAKETLSLLLVERGQPQRAPKRPEAMKTLRELVKAIEKRNGADLKDAEERLNAMSGLVSEQEIADAMMPLFQDPTTVDFLIEQGWEIEKGKAKEGGTELKIRLFDHKRIYLQHIYGGMNFGPQFRHVNGGRLAKEGEQLALCVSTLPDPEGTDCWQHMVHYRPGVLDAFQCMATFGMGHPGTDTA
jgi:tetratricopeptide (TPR) repeat protein